MAKRWIEVEQTKGATTNWQVVVMEYRGPDDTVVVDGTDCDTAEVPDRVAEMMAQHFI